MAHAHTTLYNKYKKGRGWGKGMGEGFSERGEEGEGRE
jgi:hypothetical protein